MLKGVFMKKYKINDNTLALIPLNKHKTVAYEDHNYYIIDDKVSSVLNENCEYYGSSVSGRLKGSYSLMGFSYKTPIVVSEQDNMIFFPTSSPRLNDCSWITRFFGLTRTYRRVNRNLFYYRRCC